jgi:outer membrane protein insertion porin family
MQMIWSCTWWVTVTLLAFVLREVVIAQESYAGQPVAAVDLATDPAINVQDLRALVEQKAGEPYSDQKIQASIAALSQTRKFSKVEVDVRPEAGGLHVIFVLEPAFYYGVTDFPGALHVFTYGRLLQVVNLPDQDPYQPKQVEQGEAALSDFLRVNGYFQAQVQASTELDKPHGLANVIFQVELGTRAKIGSVEVQGPPPQEARRLLVAARSLRANVTGASLKPGKTYTPERVKAATNLLRQYLIKHEHLAGRIDVSRPRYHRDSNRVDLTINVDEGPKVAVRISGARVSWVPFLGEREKRKLIPIYQEESLDPDLVEEGKRNLTNYYQAKGYFDVHVNADLQQPAQEISLVYQVDRGKKHKVAQVAFRGNYHIDANELKEHVAVRKSSLLARGKFSDKSLRQSISELKALYVDRGFEEVAITPQVDDKEPKIDVTFQIAEGQQTQVEAVNFQGNQNFEAAALSPPGGFLIRSGAPFAPGRLSKDRGRILAVYLDHGYLRADVKTKVNRHPDDRHKVDVTYEIAEGQPVRIAELAIVGEKRTRPWLIAKTTDLWTETPLSQGKLLQAESDLYNLGIFDWASVGPRRPITDQTDEEAVVKVHEAKRNTIAYGFGLEAGAAPVRHPERWRFPACQPWEQTV